MLLFLTFSLIINLSTDDKISLRSILPLFVNWFAKNWIAFLVISFFSREDLIKWVIDIHNSVNKELNKEILDYETATEIYMSGSENTPIFEMCFKLSVLIIILYFVYLVLKK